MRAIHKLYEICAFYASIKLNIASIRRLEVALKYKLFDEFSNENLLKNLVRIFNNMFDKI